MFVEVCTRLSSPHLLFSLLRFSTAIEAVLENDFILEDELDLSHPEDKAEKEGMESLRSYEYRNVTGADVLRAFRSEDDFSKSSIEEWNENMCDDAVLSGKGQKIVAVENRFETRDPIQPVTIDENWDETNELLAEEETNDHANEELRGEEGENAFAAAAPPVTVSAVGAWRSVGAGVGAAIARGLQEGQRGEEHKKPSSVAVAVARDERK